MEISVKYFCASHTLIRNLLKCIFHSMLVLIGSFGRKKVCCKARIAINPLWTSVDTISNSTQLFSYVSPFARQTVKDCVLVVFPVWTKWCNAGDLIKIRLSCEMFMNPKKLRTTQHLLRLDHSSLFFYSEHFSLHFEYSKLFGPLSAGLNSKKNPLIWSTFYVKRSALSFMYVT